MPTALGRSQAAWRPAGVPASALPVSGCAGSAAAPRLPPAAEQHVLSTSLGPDGACAAQERLAGLADAGRRAAVHHGHRGHVCGWGPCPHIACWLPGSAPAGPPAAACCWGSLLHSSLGRTHAPTFRDCLPGAEQCAHQRCAAADLGHFSIPAIQVRSALPVRPAALCALRLLTSRNGSRLPCCR